MVPDTHRVRIALRSGQTLETRECLDSDEVTQLLDDLLDGDREESPWKEVGDVTFHLANLAAIQVEEL